MKAFRYLIPLLLIPVLFMQCRKESLITDANAKLSFSNDTIVFDTVFTTIGSATYSMRVYNNNNQAIKISELWLSGGNQSSFRLNVDGLPTISTTDIEIPANDSIFIFAEVTIDPLNSNLPLVIEDSIQFRTNGNLQAVKLVAWGQDAHFHYGNVLPCNETWVNDKPHVLYGQVAVDSACQLTIQAGTRIHAHNNSYLLVYKGSLDIIGSEANPVTFEGDRLESFYEDSPGQWLGVWLFKARDSNIDYAVIKNSTWGVRMDSISDDGFGTNGLTMKNSVIENVSAAGLYLGGATFTGENLLVTNCGQFCFLGIFGGQYNLRHCTFANYWSFGTRQDPLFAMSNWYEAGSQEIIRPLINTRFDNCIFYGNNDEELLVDIKDEGAQDYLFNHCLFKTSEPVSGSRYNSAYKNFDPGFVEISEADYRLLNGAYATDRGDPLTNTSNFMDLLGNSRFDGMPDLGCYEVQ